MVKVSHNIEIPGLNWKVRNAKKGTSSLHLPHKVTHLTSEPDHMFFGMNYFLVLGSLNQIRLYCEKDLLLQLDTMASEMLKDLLQTDLGKYFSVKPLHHHCTESPPRFFWPK